tara:strand:- start:70 stop:192 length:123 start_codon:yes stop_codon:yes gene_type:complete
MIKGSLGWKPLNSNSYVEIGAVERIELARKKISRLWISRA